MAHWYFCSRSNTGCFAHLLWLDSSSDPKLPQDVHDMKGAVFSSLSAANNSQKSQPLAGNVTNAALQNDTETSHLACPKAGTCSGLPIRTGHLNKDHLLGTQVPSRCCSQLVRVLAAMWTLPQSSSSSWVGWEHAGIGNTEGARWRHGCSNGGGGIGGMKVRWHVKVSELEPEYRTCGIGLTTYIPLYSIQDM